LGGEGKGEGMEGTRMTARGILPAACTCKRRAVTASHAQSCPAAYLYGAREVANKDEEELVLTADMPLRRKNPKGYQVRGTNEIELWHSKAGGHPRSRERRPDGQVMPRLDPVVGCAPHVTYFPPA